MNLQTLLIAIATLDYDTVRAAIDEGVDFNESIPGKRPLVEAAQPAKDPTMLRLLWKAGAIPTTPWLENVFVAFEQGRNSPLLQRNGKAIASPLQDFTHNFSVSKLEFRDGTLSFVNDEAAITIPLHPFILDGEQIYTTINLEGIALGSSIEALANRRLEFPINPANGYIDGSLYLRAIHNPVDVTSITFGSLAPDDTYISATIVFDFLLDSIGLPNEKVVRSIQLDIK